MLSFSNKVLVKYMLLFTLYRLMPIYIIGGVCDHKQTLLHIKLYALYSSLTYLKYNMLSRFECLTDITAIDRLGKLYHGSRFEISYILGGYRCGTRLVLKCFVENLIPVISVSSLYKSADGLEREVGDMYGIVFHSHSNLRRILTDYSFSGCPLRKDFPVSGYVDIAYDDTIQSIRSRPLELSQIQRNYVFNSPGREI